MNLQHEYLKAVTRRHFFGQSGVGLGAVALAALLQRDGIAAPQAARAANPLAPKQPPFPAKAKHVIYLHMAGSPTQLDLFDDKPALRKFNGQPCPKEYLEGKRFAFIQGVPNMLGSPFSFARHGQSGAELSEVWKHLPEVIDDIAIVKSMHTEQFNHAPAQLMLHTGTNLFGGAALGAWAYAPTVGWCFEAMPFTPRHDLPGVRHKHHQPHDQIDGAATHPALVRVRIGNPCHHHQSRGGPLPLNSGGHKVDQLLHPTEDNRLEVGIGAHLAEDAVAHVYDSLPAEKRDMCWIYLVKNPAHHPHGDFGLNLYSIRNQGEAVCFQSELRLLLRDAIDSRNFGSLPTVLRQLRLPRTQACACATGASGMQVLDGTDSTG